MPVNIFFERYLLKKIFVIAGYPLREGISWSQSAACYAFFFFPSSDFTLSHSSIFAPCRLMM